MFSHFEWVALFNAVLTGQELPYMALLLLVILILGQLLSLLIT